MLCITVQITRYLSHPSRIKAGGRTIRYEVHKIIISLWNQEDLPEGWKEWIVVPIYKGDKTEFSNYRGISHLSATYNILSNILLSKLTTYEEENIAME